ncbi:MAG: FtsX-like permease family protein, partial [Kangiellaceae bacterium]|nr:FtsX-like permease family protein [Kangiellaceae bacterium]
TFGTKLLSGRNFTPDEVVYSEVFVEPNVVLITKSLADKIYSDGNALGKQIYFWGIDATIIGIIETMAGPWPSSNQFMDNLVQPVMALSRTVRIVVRVEESEMSTMLGEVERKLLDRNPNRVITSIRSLKETKRRSYSNDYAMTQILWTVVSLLVFITALGIVGIVSFNVSQRTKQIGIRRALGATKIDILSYFITENILITGIGIVVGATATILFNNYLVSDFQLTAVHWSYIPIGALVMFLTGILSVWAPARKASRISPAVATQTI